VMWWVLRRFCDRVIAVSEETRQYHLRVSHNSPDKVITLYNGIDIEAFDNQSSTDQQHLRAELALPADAKVLITVAVLRQPKGIQFLIESMPAILAEHPNTYYLIVGDGEYRAELEAGVKKHNVENRVIFAGFRKDIPQLMAISDIFVLPTLGDALPTVVAEAMAARKPVIASAIGGVPEMVEDGQSGLLVPSGDVPALANACISLLKDSDHMQTMGNRGREIAEDRFNIPRQARRLESVYEELLTRYGK
jgi:glycosyltransferase involved in cell wall biosynthesis